MNMEHGTVNSFTLVRWLKLPAAISADITPSRILHWLKWPVAISADITPSPAAKKRGFWLLRIGALCVAAGLVGCSGNAHIDVANSQQADPATVDYPIFYVKRSIPPQTDDLRLLRNAVLPLAATTNGTTTTPAPVTTADVYKRDSASPSANETNITKRVTGTDTYDIKDLDASADGGRIVFAMRGPLTAKMKQKDPPTWHLWEYVIATDTLQQVIPAALEPDLENNVAPHYMPDGRIVFSSTAQRQSKAVLLDEGKPQFDAQDEARTEPAFVLHVISADRSEFHQISFNQSHDRDSSVLMSGRILWSRWDNAPGKDGMHLYSFNPDGTDLQLYYGANSHMTGTNSTVIEFVRSREMQSGNILSLIRPYTDASATQRIDFGGNLVIINGNQFVENTQPLLADAGLPGPAQTPATQNEVITIPGPSPGGRFSSAFPLWDNSGRILVTWTQCRLIDPNTRAIAPCTSSELSNPAPKMAPPLYSVWMFNPTQNTLLPVMLPVEGVMVTDVVAAQPRTLQNIVLDGVPGVTVDQELFNENVGVIDIRSVYDFDGVDIANPSIAVLADPAATTAAQRPARFIRLVKPVSIPSRDVLALDDTAFGASDYMREILGYAPIEPDGSVKIKVPANVAFEMEVLDANARRIFPIQAAWLQLRPGEVITCNGCHTPATPQNPKSHGRKGVFASAYAGAAGAGPFPHTLPTFTPDPGETMAEARARVSCTSDAPKCKQMLPSVNVYYKDVWTDPAVRTPDAPFDYSYNNVVQFPTAAYPVVPTTCLDSPNGPSNWNAICRVTINYLEHIQKLWDVLRQTTDANGNVLTDHTCSQAGCHNTKGAKAGTVQVPAGQLDLTSTASNDVPAQPVSYRDLLFQEPEQEVIMGALQPVPGPPDANGNPTVVTVGPFLNAGSANGAQSSAFLNRFAPGSGSTHAGYLSPAELRLISEWLDIGAQFFNNPFDPAAPVN
jgi:Hydrazine synthase alpha subunit middle domain